ncbi:hypothetical protein BST61_g4944 [Cercospora zeina]
MQTTDQLSSISTNTSFITSISALHARVPEQTEDQGELYPSIRYPLHQSKFNCCGRQYSSHSHGRIDAKEPGLSGTPFGIDDNDRPRPRLNDISDRGENPIVDVSGIRSKRALTVLCEVEDAETGAFLRSTYGYIDRSDSAWFGRMPGKRKSTLKRLRSFRPCQIAGSMKRISTSKGPS